jgi:hypothetical protein
MSSTIRPDEFSKYAPRWSRDGTAKPRDAVALPPAPQLSQINMDEPAWRRVPSPFEGEIPPWLKEETGEPHVTTLPQVIAITPNFWSRRWQIGRWQIGIVEGLFSTAAALSFVAIAVVGVGLVLSPNAPREASATPGPSSATLGPSLPKAAAAETAVVPQQEKASPANFASRFGVSDMLPGAPTSRTVASTTKTADTAPVPAPAPAESQVSNAVYVVASADPSALRPVRSQPQADPPPVAQQPPKSKQYASLQEVQTERSPSPDSIDRMIARGEAFIAEGDVVAARLILERAAEARDPRAALALGSTYDPNVLKRMGVVGIRPEPDKAQAWYERAMEFGSGEASQRLTALAQLAR